MHRYSQLLVPLIPPSSYGREFLICGGQIFWQLAVLKLLRQPHTWEYLLRLMTISLGGALALGAIEWLAPAQTGPFIYGALFSAVAGLMMLEHIRQTRLLRLTSWLTVSWVLYRMLLLAVILFEGS